MGDHRQSSLPRHHTSEAEGRSEEGGYDDTLNLQSTGYETLGSQDPKDQDLNNGEVGLEDQEEEIPPEEVSEEEVLDAQDPGEAPAELKSILKKDEEDDVPEMSRLSITQRFPGTSTGRRRKKRRRLSELAKPKTNWQVLKDRPSVYWTEKFLEDPTLTVTMPAVSRRVEELARPRRFCLEYYSNNRVTPKHRISPSTLDYRSSSRLRELATPRIRNNIWSINMSEVSQVSRAAQIAIPSSRILQLAKPRTPATLLEEWDPVPKPKPRVSDYNRLLHLAMPKVQSEKCVPDRSARWEVLDITKKAVASPRIISLAKPKVRKDLNEGYNRHPLACMSSPPPKASPKKFE
ncbi:testicular haploid expressed gene protein isoform X2 [Sturnira hondurensis]|uniref:testicular haploid expressed gene protein isoform X2 n=1 Tax=Sturnira hondurensis TaxID=192404 RepID=UPI00187A5F98|nr:testicular haploid expressed gene protein isoform X2 [Sturnira hondurensis]